MRNAIRIALLMAGTAALGGCVEAFPTVEGGNPSVGMAVAKPVRSPRVASVALASLDGPPDIVERRFKADFAREAASRDIAVADASSARYLVRGYLSAAPSDKGTDVTFVYDIFDAQRQARVDRVSDTLTLPAASGDVWGLVDDRVTDGLAGRSADRLAAALAETPEARAAPPATEPARVAAVADGPALN